MEKTKEKSIRLPAVAGQFYPSNKEELTKLISQFLNHTELPALEGQTKILIVPHAGYVYSGGVAAYGFKAVEGMDINRVILIGSSHREYLAGGIIDAHDAWQTPLGQVDLDKDLQESLVKENNLFKVDSGPHQFEHSLEVEVPFLQKTVGNFRLLPILFSQLTGQDLEKISQSLAKYIDDKTLLVVSSDMSHYPVYQKANYADKKVIQAIVSGQVANLRKTVGQLQEENIDNLDTCLCGQTAVEVAMKIAQIKNIQDITLLKYANSGDVAIGDRSQVVGYSAIVFTYESWGKTRKEKLLNIAKTSVETYILENKIPEVESDDPLLNQSLGAFVTLKKDGQLRGCLGKFKPSIPLYQVVSQMAVAAATQDTRFYPVQANELDDLEYEISVLSPLVKIDNWQDIKIGIHGVRVVSGDRVGVFLPQVATENNWGLEEFMNNLCEHKAGLPKDIWKSNQVDLYIFTAQIIEE